MNKRIAGKASMKHHCQIKRAFYSILNKEDITDVDYRHSERISKYFNNINLGNYQDLYDQSQTLLLDDLFDNLEF